MSRRPSESLSENIKSSIGNSSPREPIVIRSAVATPKASTSSTSFNAKSLANDDLIDYVPQDISQNLSQEATQDVPQDSQDAQNASITDTEASYNDEQSIAIDAIGDTLFCLDETVYEMDENVVRTYVAVQALMKADDFKQSKRAVVMQVLDATLHADSFMDSIRAQLKKIKSDGEIDSRDLPSIFMILIKSRSYLKNTVANSLELRKPLRIDTMKYVLFGIVHYLMTCDNEKAETINTLRMYFDLIWDLFLLDPEEICISARSYWSKFRAGKKPSKVEDE